MFLMYGNTGKYSLTEVASSFRPVVRPPLHRRLRTLDRSARRGGLRGFSLHHSITVSLAGPRHSSARSSSPSPTVSAFPSVVSGSCRRSLSSAGSSLVESPSTDRKPTLRSALLCTAGTRRRRRRSTRADTLMIGVALFLGYVIHVLIDF